MTRVLLSFVGSRDPFDHKFNPANYKGDAYEGSLLTIVRQNKIDVVFCCVSWEMGNKGAAFELQEEGKLFASNSDIRIYSKEIAPKSLFSRYITYKHEDFKDTKFIYLSNPKEVDGNVLESDYLFLFLTAALNRIKKEYQNEDDEIFVSSTSGTPQGKEACYYLASKPSNNLHCYSVKRPGDVNKREFQFGEYEDAISNSIVIEEGLHFMHTVDIAENIINYINNNKFDAAIVMLEQVDYKTNAKLKTAHDTLFVLNSMITFAKENIIENKTWVDLLSENDIHRMFFDSRFNMHAFSDDMKFLSSMFLFQEWLLEKEECPSFLHTTETVTELAMKEINDRYLPMELNNRLRFKDVKGLPPQMLFLKLGATEENGGICPMNSEVIKSMTYLCLLPIIRNDEAHKIKFRTREQCKDELKSKLERPSPIETEHPTASCKHINTTRVLLNTPERVSNRFANCNNFALLIPESVLKNISPFAVTTIEEDSNLLDFAVEQEKIFCKFAFGQAYPNIKSLFDIKTQIIALLK